MPPKLNPLEAIKQSKGAKTVMSLADEVRAEMAAEKAEKAAQRARGLGVAGEDFADPTVKPTMKFSEALGITGSEGKTLNFTEADRSRVAGTNMGGTGFSTLQHYSKPHKEANTTWGFGNEKVAKRKIEQGGDPEKHVWTAYIGSPDQHKSNTIVVMDALKNVQAANKANLIHPEQIRLINQRLRQSVNKKGNRLFPPDFDITDPQALNAATTFDRRAAISDTLMGLGVKKPMISKEFKAANPNVVYQDPAQMESILRRETDPIHVGLPNYSVGPNLFTMEDLIYRPDLNIAFPAQTTGTDMGVMFEMPTMHEAAPDWIKSKGYKPGQTINPRALSMGAPTQFVDEAYLTYLQKIGRKKGGLAHMAKGGAMRGMKKLKGIYNEVETSMGRGKGAEFEQTASPLNIIKETGGNWSPSGDMVYKSRLDRELESLQKGQYNPTSDSLKSMLENAVKNGDTRQIEVLTENLRNTIDNEALNKYVTSNLKNYVTKQMATEADPVRKLAEQGIKAFPVNIDEYGDAELRTYGSAKAKQNRKDTGYVPEGVAKSPLAKHYETMTDESISMQPAKEYQRMQNLPKMQRPAGTTDSPWLLKLDPDTPIFSLNRDVDFDKLGFTHMMDVLREDVAAGRIRPEQLSKITIEQAVRRTHDYDETLKANMLNARVAEQANANVFKEYPEGYRWVQLDQPGQFALESDIMGHSVRGYEPPIGHPDYSDISGKSGSSDYGHGGYEAIKSGRAKIYSLRDPKGMSHATIEIAENPQAYPVSEAEFAKLPSKTKAEYSQYVREWRQRNPDVEELTDEHTAQALREAGVKPKPPRITQIKGKQNAAPNENYQPYVQDFVKSGDWSDVGDISNTGLMDVKYMTNPETYQKYLEQGLDVPKYATEKELEQLHNEYLRLAEPRNYKPPAEGMARGGLAYMGKGGAAKGAKAVMSLADKVRAEMAAEKAGAKAPKKLFLGEDVASQAIGKAAKSAGMNAPVTANKPLTGIQDFHTSLGDEVQRRSVEAKKQMDAFNYKYNKGQRVFTEDSAKKNKAPYEIIERYRHGNNLMWEGEPWISKKIIDPETGKAKRTPYEAGYRVRGEIGEMILPESAIKGNVDMAHGGLAYMGKGGAPKGVKKVMSLADQVRAEMAMEKRVLPASEREANLAKFLVPSAEKRRMYHGSKEPNIKQFKTRKDMTDESMMTGHYADERDAVFLSPEPEFTKNFSQMGYTDTNQAPTTYPVYVQIEKPFDFDNPEHLKQVKETYKDMFHNPESEFYEHHILPSERSMALHTFNKRVDSLPSDENNWARIENQDFQDVLKDIGFDSFYTRERGTKNLGVYEPHRIKSAIGNRGTYDLAEDDITKAHGGLTLLKRKVA